MKKDWIEVELGSVLIQSKEKHNPVVEQDLFYVGLEHIEKVLGVLTDQNRIEKITTLKNKFEKGQILYGKLRPYLNKVYLAKESGVCSTDILVFQPKNVVNGRFAHLFMLSRKFVNQMSENTSGVNLPRVSTSFINSYPFPLPPLPEQRAIVSKIEELFSELDHSIASSKAAKAKLEIYRQAVLKKAFEGYLTENWRSENNKSESRVQLKFGDLCEFTQGIQVPIDDQFDSPSIGRVRFLRIIDFTQGNDAPRFINHPGEKYTVKKDDISMVRYGTVGFVCTGKEGVVANNLFRIIPDDRVLGKYLIYFLNSSLFKSHLNPKGATMQALSFGIIKPILIPIFSLKEQTQIVQEIESRLSVADKLAETIEINLKKSEALRQSILKKAFEGKLLSEAELEACRKESDWEPAEKLLERIKSEKN